MFNPTSFRVNILSNFLIITGLVAASLLGLQYYFSQQMAVSAVHKSFTQAAKRLTQQIQTKDEFTKTSLFLIEFYPDLTLSPAKTLNLNTIRRFAHNIEHSKNIYAMYIGQPNDEFFEVINMSISKELHKHFEAPENTRWTIVRVFNSEKNNKSSNSNNRIRQYDFLDDNFNVLASRINQSTYFPTKRPWFIQASQSDKTILTDPYLFSHLQQNGITFAKKIRGSDSVLAIDFTLKKLNELLFQAKLDPSSDLILFGIKDTIIASSNTQAPDKTLNNFLTQALKEKQTNRIIRYKNNDDDKFIMVTSLSEQVGGKTHLGLTIDADVMLNPYFEQIIYSISLALIFLVFTIPLILYKTSRIVQPIKALMIQNDKIKNRQFNDVKPIDSHIIELIDLSDSLVSMSQSIQAYQKAQQELMDSFIRLLAEAIDSKSAYTGGHCQRVPEIAIMLAKIVNDSDEGEFAQFKLDTDDAWREFEMGALLHDCGKVTTPEYVVDKSTKLETIYNRIHEIRTRFEVVWRDIDIEYYQRIAQHQNPDKVEEWRHNSQQTLQDDFAFISEANIGGEFMSEDKKARIQAIAQRTWMRHFNDRAGLSDVELMRYQDIEEQTLPVVEQLLSDKAEHRIERIDFDEEAYKKQGFKLDVPEYLYNYGELYNLCIEKGTLSNEERFKIKEHVIMTIKMLEMLPFPEHMKSIPEYAGTHHETMNNTGYPRQLGKKELSIPARIMAIADIFEALTASDRPYKKGKTISEAIRIMNFMKQDEHIDGKLFDLFVQSGIYKEYAARHLKAEQIDEVSN